MKIEEFKEGLVVRRNNDNPGVGYAGDTIRLTHIWDGDASYFGGITLTSKEEGLVGRSHIHDHRRLDVIREKLKVGEVYRMKEAEGEYIKKGAIVRFISTQGFSGSSVWVQDLSSDKYGDGQWCTASFKLEAVSTVNVSIPTVSAPTQNWTEEDLKSDTYFAVPDRDVKLKEIIKDAKAELACIAKGREIERLNKLIGKLEEDISIGTKLHKDTSAHYEVVHFLKELLKLKTKGANK